MNNEFNETEHINSLPLETKTFYTKRMEICKTCEHFALKFCGKCGCFMPAKAAFSQSKCPIDRWGAENG